MYFWFDIEMYFWFDIEMQSCIDQDGWVLREEGNKWACLHRNIFGKDDVMIFQTEMETDTKNKTTEKL